MAIALWWCGIIWLRTTISNRRGGSFQNCPVMVSIGISSVSGYSACAIGPRVPWMIMAIILGRSSPYQVSDHAPIMVFSAAWLVMMALARSLVSWWAALATAGRAMAI